MLLRGAVLMLTMTFRYTVYRKVESYVIAAIDVPTAATIPAEDGTVVSST